MDNYIHPHLPLRSHTNRHGYKTFNYEIVHMYSSKLENTTSLKTALNNVNYKAWITY